MCGIFCISSNNFVKKDLLQGLKLLEYRGYDSAGVVFRDANNNITSIKSVGNVSKLTKLANNSKINSTIGLGHTRWATHGKISIENTHPIHNDEIAVVHNGIIENYQSLKKSLNNVKFSGETDTEIILNLLQKYIEQGFNCTDSLIKTTKILKGNYAIVVLFKSEPHKIFCFKSGSSLNFGISENTIYISSDINTISFFTDKCISLDDNEYAIINSTKLSVYNSYFNEVNKDIIKLQMKDHVVDNLKFSSFLLQEIHEQPLVLKNIVNDIISKNWADNALINQNINRIFIVGCGSSFNAGLASKYYFENIAKIPTDIEFSSEFNVRNIIYDNSTLYLFLSQSGETLDTMSALKKILNHNLQNVAIVNTENSSMTRLAKHVIPMKAGLEISVASTKSFTAQFLHLMNLAFSFAKERALISKDEHNKHLKQIKIDLKNVNNVINTHNIQEIVKCIINANNVLLLGRRELYPIALEGALKLRELSYLNVFSHTIGELKHGSIALIDEKSICIVLAPQNDLFDKTISNIEEIKSRGAKIILISDKENNIADFLYKMPPYHFISGPILYTISLQMIAYHTAFLLGKNVDKPRNLAKSVTVE